jgi:hypothetical protein
MPFSARETQRAELAFDAAHAESARDEDALDVGEIARGAFGRLAVIRGDPADVDLARVREPAGLERLGDGEVGVGQVDVLADQGDRDLVLRVVHGVEQLLPAAHCTSWAVFESELLDDVRVEAPGR